MSKLENFKIIYKNESWKVKKKKVTYIFTKINIKLI